MGGLRNSLKAHRKKQDLTQAQLAELTHVSRKTINTIENAVFIPSTILSLRIARALNTSVHDIFALEEDV